MACSDNAWRWVARAALLWYCSLSLFFISTRIGFHYDEATEVLGAVHMRHSSQELQLPHDPGTWMCIKGRCFPLMSASYVGAIKEYICLPLFAMFGPRAEIVRLIDMLLASVGIFGISALVGRHLSYPLGAAVAWAIAINPSFLDLTLFDNNACAPWMAAFGLLCLGVSRYIKKQDARSAFLLGVALGFGVWARTNFLWLIVAFAAAITLTNACRSLRATTARGCEKICGATPGDSAKSTFVLHCRRVPTIFSQFLREGSAGLLQQARHWAAVFAGGLLGGLPLLVYEINSRGGTWASVESLSTHASQRRFFGRVIMFADTLLSDREHRAIWHGLGVPEWQRWLFACAVLLSCVVCLTLPGKWARTLALALLILMSILFFTDLPIAEHHLLALVPIAIVVVMIAGSAVQARYRWSRPILIALAAAYVGSGLYWQVATLAGLRRTGGVGPWSDAVFNLTKRLIADYPNGQFKILDWGLQNNLYVLSDGQLRSREIFLEASAETSRPNRTWLEEIRGGGVFLLNGPTHRHFPDVTRGFLAALQASQLSFKRIAILQRSGDVYAEIIELPSGKP